MHNVPDTSKSFQRAVLFVALANLVYFAVEFAVAVWINSVSLFADSVDFLEDASVNGLILLALAWNAKARARVGMGLAFILLAPGLATLWTAWKQFSGGLPPAPVPLTLAALGALAVNLSCAFMLASHKHRAGSLSKAAFLSARNDAFANIAMLIAGGLTFVLQSIWPDLIVGLGVAALNADAARKVWQAAKGEHDAAP